MLTLQYAYPADDLNKIRKQVTELLEQSAESSQIVSFYLSKVISFNDNSF